MSRIEYLLLGWFAIIIIHTAMQAYGIHKHIDELKEKEKL